MTAPDRRPSLTRRRALSGVATVGIGLPVLAACGGGDSNVATDPNTPSAPASTSGSAGKSASGSPSESASKSAGGADALTSTSDIQVGGGTIFSDQQVVVTQPTSGDFQCFTAVCTHQGCIVSSVSDGLINCGCHGSQFSIEDGSVVSGPATAPLAAEQITVQGNAITLG